MKLFTRNSFYFIIFSLLMGANSCRRCTDDSCLNGTCIDGKCICRSGFFGLNCELNKNNSTISKGSVVFHVNSSIASSCTYYVIQLGAYGSQYITSAVSSPNCGNSSSANFSNIPYGTYQYTVSCYSTGATLSSGTVVVNSACVKQLVNVSTVNNGQVIFHTTNNNGCYPIVTIQGYGTQTMQSFQSNPSSCTASLGAFFSLPAGTYNYTAYCGNYTWTSGSVTVTANSCTKRNIGTGTYVNTGQVIFHTSQNLGCYPTVTVQGYGSQTLQSFNGNPSSCSSSLGALFTLPVGTYSYSASCGSYQWPSGTFTVSANSCTNKNIGSGSSGGTGNGRLSVYIASSSYFSLCPNFDVVIQGYGSKFITQAVSASVSNCTTTGGAHFDLPPGTYELKVGNSCTLLAGSSLGNFSVVAGGCNIHVIP